MTEVDLSKPQPSQNYIYLLEDLRILNQAAGSMMDSTLYAGVNIPVGLKRYNASLKIFEQWDGTSWVKMPLAMLFLDGSNAMTGDLKIARNIVGKAPNGDICIFASPSMLDGGASIQLFGESGEQPGVVALYASDGKNRTALRVLPAGGALLGEDRVVTSADTATDSTFGLMRVAAVEDEMDCSCADATITPANFADMGDYRQASTNYSVGAVVRCMYHAELYLQCTTAGKTSANALNTKSVTSGQTITDGTVVWNVVKNNLTEYVLPKATSSVLGGVKVGSNITVSEGSISLTKDNVTRALGYTPLQTAPVTSVNGMTGAVTISSVSTATSATTTPNVVVGRGSSFTLPSGGTWKYLTSFDGSQENSSKSGTAAGGTKITMTSNEGGSSAYIAIRTA